MMDRRIFLTTVAGLLAAPLPAEAQQAGKVYRIGVLTPSANVPLVIFDAFRQALRELGYVEGRNIAIEWRFAEGRYE